MSKKKEAQATEQPQKERKMKVIYYDDGSTVADMSGTKKKSDLPPRRKSTFREKARTFFTVMKNMILPLLCTLAAFTLIALLLLAVTGRLW